MIITPNYSYLYVFDFIGCVADFNVPNAIPIQKALEVEGGEITLSSAWIDAYSKNLYFLQYKTPCFKISFKVELTQEEYEHNLDFFGGDTTPYEPIKFVLDGNKFKMP